MHVHRIERTRLMGFCTDISVLHVGQLITRPMVIHKRITEEQGQKRVSQGLTFGGFLNSELKGGQVNRMLNLSKSEVKIQIFEGYGICKQSRYAHMVGGHTAWEGAHEVGSNPVGIRPTVMHGKEKCLSIASTNMSVSTVSLSKCYDRKNWKTRAFKRTHDKVVQCENIELKNRFQVLSSLDQVSVQFEDNALSGTSTVLTKIFPKPAAVKSRFFGHCTGTNGGQAMTNESVAHKKCCEQIGSKFGCIPVSEIASFNGIPTYWKEVPNIIQAHKLIRNSGLPNFLGLRIPVATRLKVDTWRYYLSDYFDQQLPDLIQFGFPLDFDRNRVLGLTEDNHPLAKKLLRI